MTSSLFEQVQPGLSQKELFELWAQQYADGVTQEGYANWRENFQNFENANNNITPFQLGTTGVVGSPVSGAAGPQGLPGVNTSFPKVSPGSHPLLGMTIGQQYAAAHNPSNPPMTSRPGGVVADWIANAPDWSGNTGALQFLQGGPLSMPASSGGGSGYTPTNPFHGAGNGSPYNTTPYRTPIAPPIMGRMGAKRR